MNLHERLREAAVTHAAMCRQQRVQPAFGAFQKIYPPTYASREEEGPPEHCFERRLVAEGEEVTCCLLDSTPSQANRFEDALLESERAGVIQLPYIVVDYSGTGLEPRIITSLGAPHRLYDGIIRDSELDGVPFPKSVVGQRLYAADATNATALVEIDPTVLVFGGWDAKGIGKSRAQIQRILSSEIVAFEVPVDVLDEGRAGVAPRVQTTTRRTKSRRCPVGISKKAQVWRTPSGAWHTTKQAAGEGAELVKPSEIGHGSITPDVQALGATMKYGLQTVGISFGGLRRLQFGGDARNRAARTYLAALALFAVLEQDWQGFSLRSGCDLVLEEPAPWEFVRPNGQRESVEINRDQALDAYATALADLGRQGFQMVLEGLRLLPQAKLVTIELQSRDPEFVMEDASSAKGRQ